jgi:hypothetical protein
LASMISLLYKPIICLGPRFAPACRCGSHVVCCFNGTGQQWSRMFE